MILKKYSANKIILAGLLLCLAAALLIFEVLKLQFFSDSAVHELFKGIVIRSLGALFVLVMIVRIRYDCLSFKGTSLKSLWLIAPCLLISLNNFPWLDSLSGQLVIENQSLLLLLLFALECVSVGLFEELMFRGVVFPLFLEKHHTTRKDILFAVIASSAVFGLYHLANLFAGSGFGAVILQVGYTFLFGSMLCFVLLCTKNIWLCVFLHALYNFGGLVYPTLGSGNIWSTGTILLTVFVTLAVAAYIIHAFFKRDFPFAKEIVQHQEI